MMDALAIPNCAKGRATSNASGLRVRAAPLLTGPVLGSLTVDEPVTVWAVADGWALVQTDAALPLHPEQARLTGWASLAYLVVVGELQA